MKKFLIKLSLIVVPVLLLIAGLIGYTIYRTESSDNIVYKYYSKERLESKKEIKNKIIIIGGSNILFGVNPYLLSEQTGREVLNLAYIRTIGVENMIRLAELAYTDGDVILLSLAYGDETLGPGGRTFAYRIFKDPTHLLNTDVLLSFNLTGAKEVEKKEEFDIYEDIDSNFFLLSLDTLPNEHKEDFTNHSGYAFTYGKNDLELIKEYIEDNKLNIVAFHPPLVRENLSEENLREIQNNEVGLLPVPYITSQSDYIFSADSIYDFVFHLNADGRRERTLRLAKDFNKHLKVIHR